MRAAAVPSANVNYTYVIQNDILCLKGVAAYGQKDTPVRLYIDFLIKSV